jgi:ribosomal protein S18 acetylase RimI-like enzyme
VNTPFSITAAAADSDIEVARRLFRAYAASLPFDLGFQNFAAELAGLPAPYVPPGGCLLVGRDGSAEAIGIVGLKPLAAGIAEIKRLYVVPEARGLGLGKALLDRAVEEARAREFKRVRLDSHRVSMGAAITLYRRLGFIEIPAYGPNPERAFAFFELRLRG